MRSLPGTGEVTGAIMITAAFAAAAAVLFGSFQDRTDAMQHALDSRMRASTLLATELVAVGPAQCGNGFLLHNYSDEPIPVDHMSMYGNGTKLYGAPFRDLDGTPRGHIPGGRSAWVDTGGISCGVSVTLVTPAGRVLAVWP